MLSWWVDVWMEAKESLYNAVRNWFKYKWLCPHQVTRITECIFRGGSTDSCWHEVCKTACDNQPMAGIAPFAPRCTRNCTLSAAHDHPGTVQMVQLGLKAYNAANKRPKALSKPPPDLLVKGPTASTTACSWQLMTCAGAPTCQNADRLYRILPLAADD